MPAPRMHEIEIAERIVSMIDQSLSAEMGLKVVTMGALDFFPALDDLSQNVPAVFVEPAPTTTLERITTGQTYRIVYSFRIVFVKAFAPNERVVRQKVIDTNRIAELLVDNVDLGGLQLLNGHVLYSKLTAKEWKPPEDNLVATINAALTATALVFIVEATSRK